MFSLKKSIYKTRRIDNPCPDCVAHDVTIGTQIWTGCNATVSTYANGNTIPYVDNATAWAALTTGAWCYYNNDPTTEAAYGKLYNWYAVTDPRGFAPAGYHVPTDAEWTVLTDYLGGLTVAGGKMKEVGFCHWLSPNTGATNTSLFTGLPGGYRNYVGDYNGMGGFGYWWSSTENYTGAAWYRYLVYDYSIVYRQSFDNKDGYSVRFIKN